MQRSAALELKRISMESLLVRKPENLETFSMVAFIWEEMDQQTEPGLATCCWFSEKQNSFHHWLLTQKH
jgi:hypothetical protein